MMRSEAAQSAELLQLHEKLARCILQGPPGLLGTIKHEALLPGEVSPSMVLRDWLGCLVLQARVSQDVDHFLWLQVEYKVCAPLFDGPMLVLVPSRAHVCVNHWRPTQFPEEIGPGSVELYGWEL